MDYCSNARRDFYHAAVVFRKFKPSQNLLNLYDQFALHFERGEKVVSNTNFASPVPYSFLRGSVSKTNDLAYVTCIWSYLSTCFCTRFWIKSENRDKACEA